MVFDKIVLNMDMIYITCVFFIVILLFFRIFNSKYKKKKVSLLMPGYVLIYTDQSTDIKEKNVEYGKILYSKKYDIQGKPDYIFKKILGRELVPLELKSGSIGKSHEPHKCNLLQLASYFLII